MTDSSEKKQSLTRGWLSRVFHGLLGEPQDREELIEMLRDAEERALLDPQSLTMIEGVMQVSQMQVRDIMVPRAQMVSVEEDMPLKKLLPIVIEAGHSRYPVIGSNRDEVIGILLAKDLLPFKQAKNRAQFSLRDCIRMAALIPESKRLDVLLQEFRRNRNHMAIVVDEYGSVAGLVTIEDVLEQIVGEIEDEFDVDEDLLIKKHDDHTFIVKALTPVDDFNDYFNTQFSDSAFDTIGGFITNRLGHVPKRDEQIQIGNLEFKILHADQRRVLLFQVRTKMSIDNTVTEKSQTT